MLILSHADSKIWNSSLFQSKHCSSRVDFAGYHHMVSFARPLVGDRYCKLRKMPAYWQRNLVFSHEIAVSRPDFAGMKPQRASNCLWLSLAYNV